MAMDISTMNRRAIIKELHRPIAGAEYASLGEAYYWGSGRGDHRPLLSLQGALTGLKQRIVYFALLDGTLHIDFTPAGLSFEAPHKTLRRQQHGTNSNDC